MVTYQNKTNYQLLLEEILKNKKGEKLLLHSCCAPCSTYVLEYLSEYFEITVFYYNPNIYPADEYERRKKEQQQFIRNFKSKYPISFLEQDYDLSLFTNTISGLELEKEGGKRCFLCYEMRLDKTALYAKNNHFDYFGTTLTVSPYKNAIKLNELGEVLQNKYQIPFLFSDFKKKNGYKRSIELAKEYDLYRQVYCGCIYSLEQSKKQTEI